MAPVSHQGHMLTSGNGAMAVSSGFLIYESLGRILHCEGLNP